MKAVEWAAKEHSQSDNPGSGPPADPNYKGKGLQILLTVEDRGAFTMPWSATLTFRRALDEWREGKHPMAPWNLFRGPHRQRARFLSRPQLSCAR
jgi:hypothetical protein